MRQRHEFALVEPARADPHLAGPAAARRMDGRHPASLESGRKVVQERLPGGRKSAAGVSKSSQKAHWVRDRCSAGGPLGERPPDGSLAAG
ncbi:hypothetical protein Apa02nite_011710 [Actinoplanes palleronii]|uniref:Uncharacterized protein n=1 Tax=Actinoplanes palleronii TaxID=113570 RepID=A0ABQ4B336_9ACTN|nr:hypothetical protein Apa02nite_011710 [Actinoplanes palleronii]